MFIKIGIGGRLRLAFGSMLLSLMIVGGAGLCQAAQLNAIAVDLAQSALPGIRAFGRTVDAVTLFRQLQGAAIIAPDTAMMAAIAQKS